MDSLLKIRHAVATLSRAQLEASGTVLENALTSSFCPRSRPLLLLLRSGATVGKSGSSFGVNRRRPYHQQQQQLRHDESSFSRTDGRRNCKGSISCSSQDAAVAARARAIVGGQQGSSSYYLGWEEANSNPYDERGNPGGCIQLGLAESKLSLDLLEDWFATHDTSPSPELESILGFKSIAGYPNGYHGLPLFRSVLASFMDETFGGGVYFNPDQIVVTSGATPAIELISFCLADPGDVFLMPSPAYPGFDRDVNFRSQVNLLPVQTSSGNNFEMTRQGLEQAYESAEKSGRKVRGLLIASPSNPLGTVYDEEHLLLLLNFVMEKDIHLISDEIYAGCVYGRTRFVSVAEVVATHSLDSSRVHIIYGLSKVLGLPGYQVGLLYSWNQNVLQAARSLTRFTAVSTYTQRHLFSFLSDKQFIQSYLIENQRRMGKRWGIIRNGLLDAGLDIIDCESGYFCWVSFKSLLNSNTKEEELELWRRLLYEVGISVTPGSACFCDEPGWFRLCFAFVDEKAILVALDRIKQFTSSFQGPK